MDAKEIIARRVALELRDRTLVNLGIGLPTLGVAMNCLAMNCMTMNCTWD